MATLYDEVDMEYLKSVKERIEENSELIDGVVRGIIAPYCKDLDSYVLFIKDCLKDGENPPTDDELNDFSLNLATFIYFAGGMCEHLGIRDDISRAVYKEMYHTKRSAIEKGTIADKDSLAELESQQEYIVNVCYNRAYKILKSKVENAQELLSAVKKTLSHRMQVAELTRISQ